MGMWTTENQDTMNEVLNKFSEAGRQAYDYAFTTGYLQSLCVEMLKHLPKREQKRLIEQLIESAQKLEQRAILKQQGV